MKKTILLSAILLMSFAARAQPPGNDAAPLGLELGKTRCARLTSPTNHVRSGIAAWAGGETVELKHLDRFHLPGLTRATVNCDAQDAVALVTLTFDKTALDEVTRKYDARYEFKRRTDASAENSYAEWVAANGSLELLHARDGKQFTVAYWAKGAKSKYFAYNAAKPRSAAPAASGPAAPPPAQPAPL